MAKEGEPAQPILFAGEFLETTSPLPAEIALATAIEEACQETEPPVLTAVQPPIAERETPRATLRDVRAVRSLLYNRLLLEVVRRRIERAETIILSYLLTQDSPNVQIGPYLVELDESDRICLTRSETDDWHQPYFPELETAVAL